MPTAAEDDDPELPPLDGDSDSPASDPDFGELLDEADKGEGAALDDKTAEDDPIDASELGLGDEEGGLDESADAADLDLGEPTGGTFLADEAEAGWVGEDDRPAEDAGFGLDDDAVLHDGKPRETDARPEPVDEGRDEGPIGDEDDVSESQLPDLDDDEEGSPDDAGPNVPAVTFEDEPSGLPWAAEPWARVGASWPVAEAAAVACVGKGAIVVGRSEADAVELMRLDLEGGRQSLPCAGLDPARIRNLSADGDTVVARTVDGGLFVSADGGTSFIPADDRGSAVAEGGAHSGRAPSSSAGRLPRDAPGAAPSACVAVRGSLVAYGARKGGIVRGGKGRPWSPLAWEGKVTDLAFVDDAGTLVAATYSDVDDTSSLVRVSAAGQPQLVARIGPARSGGDADGRVVALAYDDARGVLWVAGGFGVAAFSGR